MKGGECKKWMKVLPKGADKRGRQYSNDEINVQPLRRGKETIRSYSSVHTQA